MDIEQKYKILEKIMQSDDDVLLNEIDSLLTASKYDFWTGLPNGVKGAINEAQAELKKSEGISHQQVMSEVKARYLRK